MDESRSPIHGRFSVKYRARADGTARRDIMLFEVTWDFIDTSETGSKRSLQLFSKWTPGPAQFQGFYAYADGGGGLALIEAADAAALARTMAPWTPFLKFTTRPLVPIQESAKINGEAIAWREANSR